MNHSRRRTRFLLLTLALASVCSRAGAQQTQMLPSPNQMSSGTEYYVAFMQNGETGAGIATRFMGLYITSEFSTTGFIDIPGQGITQFSVERGQVTTISIPRSLEVYTTEETTNGGIHVWSRAPISIYAYNDRITSSAGFSVLPVNTWDTSYVVTTLPNAGGERTGQFMIVASADSTLLKIFPSAATHYKQAGETISKVLNRGQTFLVQANPNSLDIDLSSSTIVANKPVGLVSGHLRTGIGGTGQAESGLAGSFQVTMQLPQSQLGRDYVSMPIRPEGDRFRVMGRTVGGTKLDVTLYRPGGGTEQISRTLEYGEVFDISSINGAALNGPIYWHADNPIDVLQFRKSGGTGNTMPATITLAPIQHFSSWTSFASPAAIGDVPFTQHSLTIVARGNGSQPDDASNPLRSITLDGAPLYQKAPELLTQRIGSTDLYYATLTVDAGGHTVLSNPNTPFTGMISGSTGAGDYYLNVLPNWLPYLAPDTVAPRVLTVAAPRKGQIAAEITDSTVSYFSGVGIVQNASSTGWRQDQFDRPDPDVNGNARFTAIADPSGPLFATLQDRDGNKTTVKLSDGICFKTALPNRPSVEMTTSEGRADTDRVLFVSNSCGDAANVKLPVDKGNGSAKGIIDVGFDNQSASFTIPPNGATASMYIAVKPSAQPGIYATQLSVQIDDSTVMIPVTITVSEPAGVSSSDNAASLLSASIYPNPFSSTATIALSRPLGRNGSVVIADQLGTVVRDLSADAAAGHDLLHWDGRDMQQQPVPAGVYFVAITDGASRIIRGVTVIR